jgi:hypothetical protein
VSGTGRVATSSPAPFPLIDVSALVLTGQLQLTDSDPGSPILGNSAGPVSPSTPAWVLVNFNPGTSDAATLDWLVEVSDDAITYVPLIGATIPELNGFGFLTLLPPRTGNYLRLTITPNGLLGTCVVYGGFLLGASS